MPQKITNKTSSYSDPQIHSHVNGHHTLLKNKSVYISYFLDNTSVKITKNWFMYARRHFTELFVT